jgi:hypothetical protein
MDSAQTFAAYVWVLATIVSEADRTGEPKTPRKAHLAPESKHREKLISHPNQNTAKSSSLQICELLADAMPPNVRST